MPIIFIGWDPREAAAFAVARHSIRRRLTQPIPIRGLILDELIGAGLYRRPLGRQDGRLWDPISAAPMSTEHAISRFLVPYLAAGDWALFVDGDILALANVARLFAQADPRFAVMVVQHRHEPTTATKMDGQAQTAYPRKNWSSVCLWNCGHPANRRLTAEMVNTLPGRDLHRFCWLDDDEIGALDPAWNWLAGHSDPAIAPNIVHFTNGTPDMPGYADQPYADDWRRELMDWAGWGGGLGARRRDHGRRPGGAAMARDRAHGGDPRQAGPPAAA